MSRSSPAPFFDAGTINPLLAGPTGARALDVRGRVRDKEEP